MTAKTTQPASPTGSRSRSSGASVPEHTATPSTASRTRRTKLPGSATAAPAGEELLQRIAYLPSKGVDDFVAKVSAATPMQLVDAERAGVPARLLTDLARRMDIPAARMFTILGVPKSTASKKTAAGGVITGGGGAAALRMVRLLGIASGLVEASGAPEARDFDSAEWLGQWLQVPQPALGGKCPADFVDTSTGLTVVARLLGSIQSGSYQ